jgi:hypothetical protein
MCACLAQATLKAFREARFDILVATDVAARGLDINGVELVVQVEPPKVRPDQAALLRVLAKKPLPATALPVEACSGQT